MYHSLERHFSPRVMIIYVAASMCLDIAFDLSYPNRPSDFRTTYKVVMFDFDRACVSNTLKDFNQRNETKFVECLTSQEQVSRSKRHGRLNSFSITVVDCYRGQNIPASFLDLTSNTPASNHENHARLESEISTELLAVVITCRVIAGVAIGFTGGFENTHWEYPYQLHQHFELQVVIAATYIHSSMSTRQGRRWCHRSAGFRKSSKLELCTIC